MKSLEIAAYYVPLRWKKHCEWNLIQQAKSYVDWQQQPRVPLQWYYNDENPETMKKQIALASGYWVSAFIFDRYWKKGKLELDAPIHNFISNPWPMKFAVMRAWKTAKKDLPSYPWIVSPEEQSRRVETDVQDFCAMLEYCQIHYFSQDFYLTIDDRPYFVLYNVEWFINKLWREYFIEMMEAARSLFTQNWRTQPYISWVIISDIDASGLGLDAITGYNYLPDFTPQQEMIQEYETLISQKQKKREQLQIHSQLPYIPSIATGWDASPRWSRVEKFEQSLWYPWIPLVVGNTPALFGKFLQEGIDFAKKHTSKIVSICAWNEWSEGSYLEPDERYGYGYLEEIKKRVG
jgi:hypothetical protein